jgi:hypothetical protein
LDVPKLEEIVSPSIVVGLKGRSKNTKREKIGLEHSYDEIKGAIKKQKMDHKNTLTDSQK